MGSGCSKDGSVTDAADEMAPVDDGFPKAPYLSPQQEGKATNAEDPIRLAPQIPARFTPYKSPPRQPGEPPYKRLVLISSRVHECLQVAEHVLPNVAAVVYDWRVYTLQELLRAVKKTLGGNTVLSIAVIAPGSKPGHIGLLEGCITSADKLEPLLMAEGVKSPSADPSHPLMANVSEIAQFWRVLSTCVAKNERGEGQRIDLLACGLEDTPVEGALLLKALTQLTSVPFATGDHAKSGFLLSSYYEDYKMQALTLRASPVRALGLYFDKFKLLGIPAPKASQKASTPEDKATVVGIQRDKDIFIRFADRIKSLDTPLPQIFKKFDASRTGFLSPEEVGNLVRAVCPDARPIDVEHVACMLDADGNEGVTLAELQEALEHDSALELAVLEGRDVLGFMPALCAYLSNNEDSFREYFKNADISGNGTLDHKELVDMVNGIAGLKTNERKCLISYFYQLGGELDFDRMLHAVRTYGSHQPNNQPSHIQAHNGSNQVLSQPSYMQSSNGPMTQPNHMQPSLLQGPGAGMLQGFSSSMQQGLSQRMLPGASSMQQLPQQVQQLLSPQMQQQPGPQQQAGLQPDLRIHQQQQQRQQQQQQAQQLQPIPQQQQPLMQQQQQEQQQPGPQQQQSSLQPDLHIQQQQQADLQPVPSVQQQCPAQQLPTASQHQQAVQLQQPHPQPQQQQPGLQPPLPAQQTGVQQEGVLFPPMVQHRSPQQILGTAPSEGPGAQQGQAPQGKLSALKGLLLGKKANQEELKQGLQGTQQKVQGMFSKVPASLQSSNPQEQLTPTQQQPQQVSKLDKAGGVLKGIFRSTPQEQLPPAEQQQPPQSSKLDKASGLLKGMFGAKNMPSSSSPHAQGPQSLRSGQQEQQPLLAVQQPQDIPGPPLFPASLLQTAAPQPAMPQRA